MSTMPPISSMRSAPLTFCTSPAPSIFASQSLRSGFAIGAPVGRWRVRRAPVKFLRIVSERRLRTDSEGASMDRHDERAVNAPAGYGDLRGWIERVEKMNELVRVNGAHWDAEMGAITQMLTEKSRGDAP